MFCFHITKLIMNNANHEIFKCCSAFLNNSSFCNCDDSMLNPIDCNAAFGMEDGKIKDTKISASSELDAKHAAIYSRLHFLETATEAGGWKASTADANQWLQIDLGTQHSKVTGVATQGRNGPYNEYVRSYKLQHSNDGVTFQYYKEPAEAVDKVK